jgi:hypothetical protein
MQKIKEIEEEEKKAAVGPERSRERKLDLCKTYTSPE